MNMDAVIGNKALVLSLIKSHHPKRAIILLIRNTQAMQPYIAERWLRGTHYQVPIQSKWLDLDWSNGKDFRCFAAPPLHWSRITSFDHVFGIGFLFCVWLPSHHEIGGRMPAEGCSKDLQNWWTSLRLYPCWTNRSPCQEEEQNTAVRLQASARVIISLIHADTIVQMASYRRVVGITVSGSIFSTGSQPARANLLRDEINHVRTVWKQRYGEKLNMAKWTVGHLSAHEDELSCIVENIDLPWH